MKTLKDRLLAAAPNGATKEYEVSLMHIFERGLIARMFRTKPPEAQPPSPFALPSDTSLCIHMEAVYTPDNKLMVGRCTQPVLYGFLCGQGFLCGKHDHLLLGRKATGTNGTGDVVDNIIVKELRAIVRNSVEVVAFSKMTMRFSHQRMTSSPEEFVVKERAANNLDIDIVHPTDINA